MHAVMHAVEDSASLGAAATYGLVSDQSPSAFLESPSPARFSEIILLLRLRRPGDRTALVPKPPMD
jgi:hypothetical protein